MISRLAVVGAPLYRRRYGAEETAFPHLLHGRVYADFRKTEAYFPTALDLLLTLYAIGPQEAVAVELRASLAGWT